MTCPFIVLTAFPEWELERRVLRLGGTVLLSKPAKLADVAAAIERAIDAARAK